MFKYCLTWHSADNFLKKLLSVFALQTYFVLNKVCDPFVAYTE